MSRFCQSSVEGVRIPSAWRGNCECGRWVVVLRAFTPSNPLRCECGRDWFVDSAGEARFRISDRTPAPALVSASPSPAPSICPMCCGRADEANENCTHVPLTLPAPIDWSDVEIEALNERVTYSIGVGPEAREDVVGDVDRGRSLPAQRSDDGLGSRIVQTPKLRAGLALRLHRVAHVSGARAEEAPQLDPPRVIRGNGCMVELGQGRLRRRQSDRWQSVGWAVKLSREKNEDGVIFLAACAYLEDKLLFGVSTADGDVTSLCRLLAQGIGERS